MKNSRPKLQKSATELTQAAWQCLNRNRIREAIQLCTKLNSDYPADAEGWQVASCVALKAGNTRKALEFVNRAIRYAPGRFEWLVHKADCLLRLGQKAAALEVCQSIQASDLSHAPLHNLLGGILSRLERQQDALDCYNSALAIDDSTSETHYNKASVLRFLGRIDEAEESCEQALKLEPRHVDACLLMSSLKKQSHGRNHIPSYTKLLPKLDSWQSRVRLHYALAKEHEDLGHYSKAFQHFKAGADLRRQHMTYRVEDDIEVIDTIIDSFNASFFRNRPSGYASSEPIFILGLPRVGSTLVDRIISNHTDVVSAGELNDFANCLIQHTPRDKPTEMPDRTSLVKLTTQADFASIGADYVENGRPLTDQSARFTDKLPLNFLYVGLIYCALPSAKIVHVRRHPLDTCLAIYKQFFQSAYPFSYNLEDIAQYFIAYHRLMSHWETVIPEVVIHIDYEDLLMDFENETRQLIDSLGLSWQDKCLNFQDNQQAVTTASASQVRQGLYRSSISHWKDYQSNLRELINSLEEAGIDLGLNR